MTKIISFNEAIQMSKEKRHLLLGNGFSIALFPNIFSYNSLLQQADFQNIILKKVFDILKTSDFEKVIKSLKDASKINSIYLNSNESIVKQLIKDSEILKNILVETITKTHPEKVNCITKEQFYSANHFLSHFREDGNKIYTLNYDLLLYWTLLSREDKEEKIDDGFRNPDLEFGADYRTFDSPHSPTFWYLHGGLHIFDAGNEVRKYVWLDTGLPIMKQVQEALSKELYPLFVAEGTSSEKLEKISHSGYLSKALRSFESICKPKKQNNSDLFIYGHSLAENDDHILSKIAKGSIGRVFISLFNPESPEAKKIINRAEQLKLKRKPGSQLEIIFFDASSANVWGENTRQ